ncbi:MAG: hypothetical protein ACLGIO_08615 [Acidimicrobiia bacterium]
MSRTRLAVGVVATLAVVVVAVAARPRPAGPERRATRSMGLAEAAAPAPARTEAGARAAAVAVATGSQDWLYLDDAGIDAAVRAVATPAAGPPLAAETVAALRTARSGLGAAAGRVWWLVRPLATRVEHYGPERARVVVWTVSVLSAAGVALPQAERRRVGVDLAWSGRAWLAEAVRDTPGPTPAVGPKDGPWEAGPFDDALAGFERVGSPVR